VAAVIVGAAGLRLLLPDQFTLLPVRGLLPSLELLQLAPSSR